MRAVLALVALRRLHIERTAMRCFLWFFVVVSFTMATWNMVTVALLGGGDWGEVTEGLDQAGIWTAMVVATGVVVAVVGVPAVAAV